MFHFYTFISRRKKTCFLVVWKWKIGLKWVTRKKEFIQQKNVIYRSSCTEVFCKKGVLRNLAKFTGKHLCQILFFNKVAGLPATLLKYRIWHKCFPVNFAKFLRTPFVTRHLWWLLLWIKKTVKKRNVILLLCK